MKVTTAVITTAGFGTRFLPATRTVPKMILPVLDTPLLHFAVLEAVEAGIERVVFVTSPGQEAIEDYFRPTPKLEAALAESGKTGLLDRMRAIAEMAEFSHVVQHEQLGLGHAVLQTRGLVGDQPFALFLPDDLIWHDTPTIGAMIDILDERGGNVIAVKEVLDEAVPNLGIVDVEPLDDRVYRIKSMVEKPRLEDAPSNLAIIGRYVLLPEIFEVLERTEPGAIGEVQITDALATMIESSDAFAYRFPGVHFDAGTPLGMLKASIHQALERDDIADDLRAWLSERIKG